MDKAMTIAVIGAGNGGLDLDRVTTDLATAIEGTDIAVICTGGHRQATVAEALAPLALMGLAGKDAAGIRHIADQGFG